MNLIKIRGSIYNLDHLVSAVETEEPGEILLRFCGGLAVPLSRGEAAPFREIPGMARARELVATPEVVKPLEPEVAEELAVMRVLCRLARERGNAIQVTGRVLGLAAHVVPEGRLPGALDRLESQGKIRMTATLRTRRIEVLDHEDAGGRP